MAEKAGDPRLRGASLLALAEILLDTNNLDAALKAATEAADLFNKPGQADSEWRAWLMAGRAHQLLGDSQTARAEFLKADQIFTGLEQRFGSENYRRYQERHEVDAYRKELTHAAAGGKG